MRRNAPIMAAALLGMITPAFGWGSKGHSAIADAAWSRLDFGTRRKITAIMRADRDAQGNPTGLAREFRAGGLAGIASWPDEVRAASRHQGPMAFDAEALAFNTQFPDNGAWHYVDLPLGAARYQDGAFGTAHDDVVHAIRSAVRVIESPAPTRGYSRAEAVAMLVHFVGDIHQPLHCGDGYYSLDAQGMPHRVDTPRPGQHLYDDRGGNQLEMTPGPHPRELHAHWDIDMVTVVEETAPGHDLARDLAAGWSGGWIPNGDYHDWAARWASDTVRQARLAYQGVSYTGAAVIDPRHSGELHIPVRLEPGYDEKHAALARTQLRKAACRLHAILTAMHWPPQRTQSTNHRRAAFPR